MTSDTAKHSPEKTKVYTLLGWSVTTQSTVQWMLARTFALAFESELSLGGMTFLGRRGMIDYNQAQTSADLPADAAGFYYPFRLPHLRKVAANDQGILEQEFHRINDLGAAVILHDCAMILNRFQDISFTSYPNIYAFGNRGTESGECAGRYLIGKGHRKVAYFSYSHENWNTLRHQGLEIGLIGAGSSMGEAVSFHVGARKVPPSTLAEFQMDDPPEILKLISRELLDGYEIQSLSLARRAIGELFNVMIADHHRTALQPHFEKAIADPNISAWVASDSTVANAAIDFLRSKKVRIPGQISLLGIDDDFALAQNGITGIHLRREHMGYLAAHAILGDQEIARNPLGLVDCPSIVVERGSVAEV